MTEREYIDATNLAKLRLAIHALGETLASQEQDKLDRSAAMEAMYQWQDRLEKLVKTRR